MENAFAVRQRGKEDCVRKILLIVCASLLLCMVGAGAWLGREEVVSAANLQKKPRIVLDAGHGTPDGGAVGTTFGTQEAVLNLAIAEKLRVILQDAGYEVIMTRETDAQLHGSKRADMAERRRIIQQSGQVMTVSIHQNFYEGDAAVSGPQVFYAPGSESGQMLAAAIQKALNDALESARTEHEGDYYIVKSGEAPAVIVECGFLSNAEDEAKLVQSQYQVRIARAIFAGMEQYLEDTQK